MKSRADYLRAAIAALEEEQHAQRRNAGSGLQLEDGIAIEEDGLSVTYRFTLAFETQIPDGSRVTFRAGLIEAQAVIIHREGLTILLEVSRDDGFVLPERIDRATMTSSPWFLTKSLRERIETLQSGADLGLAGKLIDRILGEPPEDLDFTPTNRALLNREQNEAVGACAAASLWFVWGPPGTGKTSTLGHVIDELVRKGETVLVTAHSHVALDTALISAQRQLSKSKEGERLLAENRVIRSGVSVLDDARSTGLAARDLVFRSRPDLADEDRRLQKLMTKAASKKRPHVELRELRTARGRLRAKIRAEENQILQQGSVIFSTLAKANTDEVLVDRRFDAVIVDEVSMSSNVQVVAVATAARERLLVFGDFEQLPPIVIAEDPATRGILDQDVFTACRVPLLAREENPPGLTMLREQYRMAPAIRQLISDFRYRGRLRDGDGVAMRTKPMADAAPVPGEAVVWQGMAQVGARCWTDHERRSRFNPVSAIHSFHTAFLALEAVDSAVILAPYRPQVGLIQALLRDAKVTDRIRLGTVHRFQGSEGDAVVFDLVDAPPRRGFGTPLRGETGAKLLNVGLSRARGKLVVLGHDQLTRLGDEYRMNARLLAKIAATPAPAENRWSIRQGDLSVDYEIGFPSELQDLAASDLTALWLPKAVPSGLSHLPTGIAAKAEADNIVAISGSTTWVCSRTPKNGWATLTVISPRFANAFSTAATGRPAASVSDKPRDRETDVARHDRCAACGAAARLDEVGHYRVLLRCSSCDETRWPTLVELTTWAWEVGASCPDCSSSLQAARGQSRPYFHCSGKPRCDGTLFVNQIVERPSVPEDQRPKRAQAPARTARRSTKPQPRARSGHAPADLAAFEDFDIDRDEAARWLDRDIGADLVGTFIVADISIDTLERRCESGENAIDIWRQLRQAAR